MPIVGAELRRVMGFFVTGVTVITTLLDDEPWAMTANSVTSVSLDPPLMLFCGDLNSVTLKAVQEGGFFAVSILDASQEGLARQFAAKGPKSFDGIGYRLAKCGAPVLEHCLAWLDCTVYADYDGGDHRIIIGRVEDAGVGESPGPLVFYRGGYHALES
jgi:flavin reductase (DIM6/NTAB) family NADH-FMN oxidoreductase RutF